MKYILNIPKINLKKLITLKILVHVKQNICVNQILIIGKNDSYYVEILSPVLGKIKKIYVQKKDFIISNQKIMYVKDSKEHINEKKILLPDIGNEKLEVTEIMVKKNDVVKIDQHLITVEGNKTSIEIPATENGIIKKIIVNIGDKIKKNTPIIILKRNQERMYLTVKVNQKKIIKNKENYEKNFSLNKNFVYSTPAIKKIAREFNIDLRNVVGSGRKNRITREDIKNYVKKIIKKSSNINIDKNLNKKCLLLNNTNQNDNFGQIETINLSNNQRIIGKKLHENWINIPHITQFEEIDITDVEKFRIQQNIELQNTKYNIKLTLLVFIIKAIGKTLKKFTKFNSSLSKNKKLLIIKKYINIGIAVDTEKDLVVPIIKHVDKKNIIEIANKLKKIVYKARANKLNIHDMKGGCFTISSLGHISGKFFTPIINAPEVAILGISKYQIKPIWNEKKFEPRLILPVSLSYDHRVINGADGARFINFLKYLISDIRRLLM